MPREADRGDRAPRLWVAGWLMQMVFLVAGGALLWNDVSQQGATFIVGSGIIGVMRQIERERRASERED